MLFDKLLAWTDTHFFEFWEWKPIWNYLLLTVYNVLVYSVQGVQYYWKLQLFNLQIDYSIIGG
jgi:hypothetical protein